MTRLQVFPDIRSADQLQQYTRTPLATLCRNSNTEKKQQQIIKICMYQLYFRFKLLYLQGHRKIRLPFFQDVLYLCPLLTG